MPGRRWTGEEKTNIMREILTASTPTAEVCRKTTSGQPCSIVGKQVSFKQVQ